MSVQAIAGQVNEDELAQYDDGEVKAKLDRTMLRIPYRSFTKFFSSTIPHILDNIIEKLQQPELQVVKNIIVMGGFASSLYLRQRLKEAIPEGVRLTYAQRSLEAVMFGAVKQEVDGECRPIIVSRVAPRTIGIGCIMSGTKSSIVERGE